MILLIAFITPLIDAYARIIILVGPLMEFMTPFIDAVI